VMQDFAGEQFNIRLIILRFFQKMILRRTEEEKLRAQFVLQENLQYKRDRQMFEVKTGEYNLVWAPGKETIFHFSKEREYHLLHIYYEPELIQQLNPGFPATGTVPNEKMIHIIKPQFKETIDQILAVPYKNNIVRFYYENQVRDVMFYLLFRGKEEISSKDLSPEDITRIEKVEQIILKDITVHYSIPELARKAKMGQFKLKSAFKKVTGMGLFECLKEARLHKARQLILETDVMIRIISEEVGYESITGFIDAFRSKYGMSPTAYRKKYRLND
jgi:AraC-like DNA-binding protein